MKITGVSRRALFTQLDRPALVPLPRTRYELAEWKPCRVNIDYHVEVDHNFYSVPSQLVHARVEARFTQATVEAPLQGTRVSRRIYGSPAGAGLPRTWRTCRARIAPTPNGRRRA